MNLVYFMATATEICSDPNLKSVLGLVGTAVQIILIVIPAALVIFGLMDLAKAVMAGEDKEIKAAQKLLIRRLIYTVIAFLFVFIVRGALTVLVPDESKGIVQCLNTMFGQGK